MLKALSEWIRKIASGPPAAPDPDGDALAKLLFEMPDPIELMAPMGAGSGLSGPGSIGGPMPAQTRSQRRAELMESTSIFFVARPASMKALRDKGFVRREPDGSESAELGGRSIPFFGYADASMDERHWGLELRRLGARELSGKELHALREAAAQGMDEGGRPPKRGGRSTRSRI